MNKILSSSAARVSSATLNVLRVAIKARDSARIAVKNELREP